VGAGSGAVRACQRQDPTPPGSMPIAKPPRRTFRLRHERRKEG
jgi:hypothetical protein